MPAHTTSQPLELALNQAVSKELTIATSHMQGNYLLQVGGTYIEGLARGLMKHAFMLASEKVTLPAQTQLIIGTYHDLPFLTDSIDVAIYSHILEFVDHPSLILREMWRVLVPEGCAVIIGYNSNSLFGLPSTVKKNAPNEKLLSPNKLRKLLVGFGFELVRFKTFFFRPPVAKAHFLNKLSIFERMGQLCWPSFGCFYLFVVRKTVVRMTPIRLKWHWDQVVETKGIAQPTLRGYINGKRG